MGPDFAEDPIYLGIRDATGRGETDPDLFGEYAASKWLEISRPDYRDAVARVSEEIKRDIKAKPLRDPRSRVSSGAWGTGG